MQTGDQPKIDRVERLSRTARVSVICAEEVRPADVLGLRGQLLLLQTVKRVYVVELSALTTLMVEPIDPEGGEALLQLLREMLQPRFTHTVTMYHGPLAPPTATTGELVFMCVEFEQPLDHEELTTIISRLTAQIEAHAGTPTELYRDPQFFVMSVEVMPTKDQALHQACDAIGLYVQTLSPLIGSEPVVVPDFVDYMIKKRSR